jgi:LysM repeat protein
MNKLRWLPLLLLFLVMSFSVADSVMVSAQDGENQIADWTVLIFMAADNNLESFALKDIAELERIGSTDNVNVIVQLDRAEDYVVTVDDWQDTRRFLIQAGSDDDVETIESLELENIGETNTGDPATLADFAIWGIENYPAERYALIVWDHGGAWLGIATDDSADGDSLKLPEIEHALQTVIDTGKIEQFDLIGFDACLMGSLELYRTIAPYGRYAIASPALVPIQGWDYQGMLAELTANPAMDGEAFGRAIVDTFHTFYENLAKIRFYSMGLIDLSQTESVDIALRQFSELVNNNPEAAIETIHAARYGSPLFGGEFPATSDLWSALDLLRFMESVVETTTVPELSTAAEAVIDAENRMILHYKASAILDDSSGISIYFPRSLRVYRSDPGYTRYIEEAPPSMAFWTTFLNTIYEMFLEQGLPDIEIDWLVDVENQALFNLVFDTSGLAQAFFYILYQADDNLPILVEYRWLTAGLDGEAAEQQITWAQQIPILTDSLSETPVLIFEAPGAPGMGAVGGMYIPQDGSPPVMSQITFDLETQQAVTIWGAYEGVRAMMMPFEIVPENGDHFEPFWYSLAFNNELTWRLSGTRMVFSDAPLRFFWRDVPPNSYTVGVSVEDLGGNIGQEDIPIVIDEQGPVPTPEQTPEPTPCVPRDDWTGRYTVQPNDALAGIAANYGLDVYTFAEGNCIEDITFIVIGQVLRTPFVNTPPLAVNDGVAGLSNAPTVISVLGNDYDSDGTLDPASVTIMSLPMRGGLTVDPFTGNITYTPVWDSSGTDSFTYVVSDNYGAVSNIATVTISVPPPPPPPPPPPQCVTNLNDSGPNSLRWCINNTAAGGTIDFVAGLSGTISLNSQLVINKNLTIVGPGAGVITVSGNNNIRVLHVQGGSVSISGLQFYGGNASSYPIYDGGGIWNQGSLTLNNCWLINNTTYFDGVGNGGAIFNDAGATLNVNNSRFEGNSADGRGMAIFNISGQVTVNRSAILYSSGWGWSTIFNQSGVLNMTNSTVSSNSGDGIWNDGSLSLSFVTITNNSGIGLDSKSGIGLDAKFGTPLRVVNSIIASNGNSNCNFLAAPNPNSGNFSNDASCSGFTSHPFVGNLGLLTNGFIPLQPTNPAINRASCVDVGGGTVSTSQNGRARPTAQSCDAGAFESNVSGLPPMP